MTGVVSVLKQVLVLNVDDMVFVTCCGRPVGGKPAEGKPLEVGGKREEGGKGWAGGKMWGE